MLKKSSARDTLYATPHPPMGGFRFDAQVAAVFPDMINRSVPGYALLTTMLSLLAERYVQPGSRVYDLGCSLGAATLALQSGASGRACRWLAVDQSEAMCTACRTHLAAAGGEEVEVMCADIRTLEIKDASLTILNFTLQFIPPSARLEILCRIYRGLRPGGVLVLSEKLLFAPPQATELVELHHAFKRANGYSELEIAQKRAALENVLVPDSLEQHQQRLREAGFRNSALWFQCLNFASILAWKT
jgi:tRNA (cmo5U34)-methyltransferase